MIHRFSNNLSSKNNTKYKVIPSYLNKFINHLMVDGKKGIAVEIFADSLRLFYRKLQEGRETPLLIKNQRESCSKKQTFLLDDRYHVPAFAVKPMPHSPGVDHCHHLAKPSACLSKISICLETWKLRSLAHQCPSVPIEDGQKMGKRWALMGKRWAPDEQQTGNTFKSALQSSFDSIKYPSFLQRPGAHLLGLPFCPPFCSSLPIKDQYQRSMALYNLRSTKLISDYGRGNQLTFRQPAANDYQHYPSLPVLIKDEHLLKNLAEPSKEGNHALIINEQFQDWRKMENDGVRQKVLEKTILPCKKHHCRKSNGLSPSLINCLEQAVMNVEPSLEVRKKKIAGITRQIPSTLSKLRGQGLAIRWIVESARGRRRKEGKRFSECLAEELVSAYHKKGEPRQKRDALHKLAESSRSFLRYRWW